MEQQLAIDEAFLEQAVRRLTSRDDLQLGNWDYDVITGGLQGDTSVFQLSGDGISAGETVPWAMMLKIIHAGEQNARDPQGYQYWLREARYYQSGFLDNLPPGLRAPRCFGVEETPENSLIFLEEVHDRFGLPQADHGWPLEFYRAAARSLGRFNGAYLNEKQIPSAPWVPRLWLRSYLENAAPGMDIFRKTKTEPPSQYPYFHRIFAPLPPDLAESAWEERGRICAMLEGQPQVFTHQDAFCRNLFARQNARGSDDLVGIDWNFAGPAPLGAELAPLVYASLVLGMAPFSDSRQIEELALEGYLEGLRDLGCTMDPDQVRLNYNASLFWRYILGALIGEAVYGMLDESTVPIMEAIFGLPIDQLCDRNARLTTWALPAYTETHRLMKKLNLQP